MFDGKFASLYILSLTEPLLNIIGYTAIHMNVAKTGNRGKAMILLDWEYFISDGRAIAKGNLWNYGF